MLNKILFCKSIYKSNKLKVYSHSFPPEGVLNSMSFTIGDEDSNLLAEANGNGDGVISIRSTDK